MKKMIIFSTLLTSLLTIAGPKADLERANKLFDENKQEEAIKILKKSKNAKGEEEIYEHINYILSLRYSSSLEEMIGYLKKAVENPESTSQDAVNANYRLVNFVLNEEKIKYLEILINRIALMNKKDPYIEGVLAGEYKVKNMKDKFNNLLKSIENSKDQIFIDKFNLSLGNYLLVHYGNIEGQIYLYKAIDSKDINVKSGVYLSLADYNIRNNNFEMASRRLKEASISEEKYASIANRFKEIGDFKSAYIYSEKAYNFQPNILMYLENAFAFAYKVNDSKAIEKYQNMMKKKGAKNIHFAYALFNQQIYQGAEEYAKLALKDGSKNASSLLKYIEQERERAKKR